MADVGDTAHVDADSDHDTIRMTVVRFNQYPGYFALVDVDVVGPLQPGAQRRIAMLDASRDTNTGRDRQEGRGSWAGDHQRECDRVIAAMPTPTVTTAARRLLVGHVQSREQFVGDSRLAIAKCQGVRRLARLNMHGRSADAIGDQTFNVAAAAAVNLALGGEHCLKWEV